MDATTEIAHLVGAERLGELLTLRGEADEWDFKRTFDVSTNRSRAELARDIMALANSDAGGHLIFGVDDKSFEPVGLTDDVQLDTTRVYNAIAKYTQANISFVCATHQVTPPGLSQERRIGVIYVSRYKGIAAIPSCDATFDDARTGKTETLFRRGDLIVRRGAQSTRADQGALDRVAARLPATPEEPKDRSLTVSIPPSSEIGERFVGRRALAARPRG